MNKLRDALYQVVLDDRDSRTAMIELATNEGNYFKMFDLVDPVDRFIWIVLKGYYKQEEVPYKKGVEIKVVLDENNELVEIVPPTLNRR